MRTCTLAIILLAGAAAGCAGKLPPDTRGKTVAVEKSGVDALFVVWHTGFRTEKEKAYDRKVRDAIGKFRLDTGAIFFDAVARELKGCSVFKAVVEKDGDLAIVPIGESRSGFSEADFTKEGEVYLSVSCPIVVRDRSGNGLWASTVQVWKDGTEKVMPVDALAGDPKALEEVVRDAGSRFGKKLAADLEAAGRPN